MINYFIHKYYDNTHVIKVKTLYHIILIAALDDLLPYTMVKGRRV